MGFVLDAIIKKDLVGDRDDDGTTNYDSVNMIGETIEVDVSGSEQGGLITLSYVNGIGNDFDFTVQGSADGISYGDLQNTEATENIIDSSGEIIFDLTQINANYLRLAWVANSGSMDIYVRASFKRRH